MQDIVCAEELKILADILNEQGGVTVKDKRYEFEIFEEDIKSTFDGVSSAVNTLIYDKGVKFMIGPSAFFNPAASPITNENKVLHFINYSTMKPGECDATTPYTYWTRSQWPSMVAQYDVFLQENYPTLGKKWGIIAVDDGGIPNMQTATRALFAAAQIEDVQWVGYANETQDFTPIAAKLNQVNCDAYFHLNGIVTHGGGILKGLRELGNNRPYLTCLTANAKDIQTIVGGSKLSDLTTKTITPGSPYNSALVNQVIERLQAKMGQDTSVYMDPAEGLYVLFKLIEKAQTVDPTEVKNYMDQQTEVDTLFGKGIMSGEKTIGRRAYVTHPENIQLVKDGKIIDAGLMPVAIPLP